MLALVRHLDIWVIDLHSVCADSMRFSCRADDGGSSVTTCTVECDRQPGRFPFLCASLCSLVGAFLGIAIRNGEEQQALRNRMEETCLESHPPSTMARDAVRSGWCQCCQFCQCCQYQWQLCIFFRCKADTHHNGHLTLGRGTKMHTQFRSWHLETTCMRTHGLTQTTRTPVPFSTPGYWATGSLVATPIGPHRSHARLVDLAELCSPELEDRHRILNEGSQPSAWQQLLTCIHCSTNSLTNL